MGLRPGEKLYEELLIDGNSSSTKNPLIFKANEKYIESEKLWKTLPELEKALSSQNQKRTFILLKELVPEWSRQL